MTGKEMVEQGKSTSARQNIILENRERASISGVREVLTFDDGHVCMQTALGELTVRGEALHVEKLAVESGEALITGHISDISYQEPSPTLWERLFG